MSVTVTFLLLGFLTHWVCFSAVSADLGICRLPPDGGRCFILQERWFYNTDSKQCEPFNYGGCGGNKNNFSSREHCEIACIHYEKSGLCPDLYASFFPLLSPCYNTCQADFECPGNLKCCKNSCGHMSCSNPSS